MKCNLILSVIVLIGILVWPAGRLRSERRLIESLYILSERVLSRLLDVFQYLAVKLLFGILNFEDFRCRKHFFESFQIGFFKFRYPDFDIGYGVNGIQALLLGLAILS